MTASHERPTAFSARAARALGRFVRDERGDSIQWVMGLAIAAVIVAALYWFGKDGLETLNSFWSKNTAELKVTK
jgi:Flp pilus assembly pilin Flp